MYYYYEKTTGTYIGGFSEKQSNAKWEVVTTPPDHAYKKFKAGKWTVTPEYEAELTKQALVSSDSDMIRIIEDIVDYIGLHNLPAAAQAKINNRKSIRG